MTEGMTKVTNPTPEAVGELVERREAIARIIDPVKFAAFDKAGIAFGRWVEGSPIERGVRATLAKADAILALERPHSKEQEK